MNKKIMSKLIVATVLVGGVNFVPVNFTAENLQIVSVAYAEVKDVTAKDAAILDFADESPKLTAQVQNVAKMRAIERAKERAGVFLQSFSRTVNGVLTADDISAYTSNAIKIEDVKYQKLFYQVKDASGNLTGKVGFMYEAIVTAKIDTAGLLDYIQKSAQEKQTLIAQDKNKQKNVADVNAQYEALRKNANQKTPAQINAELEQINQKISAQNKPVEQKNIPMLFSQIVKVGSIGYPPDGDITIENATYISSKPKAKFQNEITYPLDTDIKFNSGEDSIYAHEKTGYNVPTYFGDENIKNTIAVETGLYGISIYQLKSNSSIKFYLLQTQEADAGFVNWVCIGKKDGKWIKYFDLKDIRKKYFGEKNWHNYVFALYLKKITNGNYTYPIIYCQNNAVIMEYQKYESSAKSYVKGEFRFKWDESAQWFGIEQVKY